MSYALIVAETRRGVFEERNLDAVGFSHLLGKDGVLLIPEGAYTINEKLVSAIIKANTEETAFLNPLTMVKIIEKVIQTRGKPEVIIFTSSSTGGEQAAYTAGYFDLPLITDVSGFDRERSIFYKSYYSDKIFGEFRAVGQGPYVLTVRSGSFKEHVVEKETFAVKETISGFAVNDGRDFMEYVEEEKGEIDITKADFLLSVGRGIGSKDEIPEYEGLALLLRAVLSGSRPVIDKMWLPKPRQVGTSGKTVKPKVYLAMGISGAFQHIAGMKDSECIIAVNKDPEAPIFQYAHFGIIGDIHKVRDKLRDIINGP
ncbi:MAG TPA: electron transfer flavoprotein subunit alpha/FixB family protein [Syntrophorhabdaceae bacterium]|nr:electron transfer flavoprotein subunit alpha/FixB family protein [Syntrophorhabdaceae bacterium]